MSFYFDRSITELSMAKRIREDRFVDKFGKERERLKKMAEAPIIKVESKKPFTSGVR